MKMSSSQSLRSRACAALVLGAAGVLAAGCGSEAGTGGTIFEPRDTQQGVAPQVIVRVDERWLAYLADEASTGPGGTDLNNNGSVLDQVAVLVNMVTEEESVLRVAALDLSILGTRLFLVVDEAADGRDWDSDGFQDDVVLLTLNMNGANLNPGAMNLVATLANNGAAHVLSSAADRLYFVDRPVAALVAPDTALCYVTEADPTTLVRVENGDPVPNIFQAPRLLALDEGLLFVTLDEVAEARELNGDGDSTDTHVLALLDATKASSTLQNVGLAVRDDQTPVRALRKTTAQGDPSDWTLAFLVDEAAQGINFNSLANTPAPWGFSSGWKPTQCTVEDADTLDQVLFFMNFRTWLVTPAQAQALVNTGLAGADRVLLVRSQVGADFVATITPEGDAACNLNGDADEVDRVFRWTRASHPVLPFNQPARQHAVANVPGGTFGVTDLPRQKDPMLELSFVIVVSEADDDTDHDGDSALTHDLVAWLDPADGNSATWTFDHNGNSPNGFVGTGWMAERKPRDRLLAAFQEDVANLNVNTGGDNDQLDSAPTFARFDPADTSDFDFIGPPVATSAINAGATMANEFAFYRVDEDDDNRDWNGDGQKNDFILFRSNLPNFNNSAVIAVLNDLQVPAVFTGGDHGVAFIADESMANFDFNNDGDEDDFVLRWFRIGP